MGTAGRAVITGAAYLLAARYAVTLRELAAVGAVFWPPAGVTVTALLVSKRMAWPAILAVVGAVELVNDHVLLGFALGPSVLWAVANVLEPLVVAWLVQRWRADRLDDVRSTVLFLVAVFVGPVMGGLLGAAATASLDVPLPYPVIAGQWMIGDGLGILTLAPLGLVLCRRIPASSLRTAEGVLALSVMLGICLLVFRLPATYETAVLEYLVLLPMVWAAIRLRVAGAAAVIFILAQVVQVSTAIGRGPFASPQLTELQSSALLQFFVATVAVTALLLASRTVESATFHDLAAAREQLVAAVSHELRTPLTPILGFSKLLLERNQELDQQSRLGLEAIHRNGKHLTSLVDDLLLLSRARRAHVPTQPESVSLDEFIHELLADRGDDDVEVVVADPDARAWTDATHLTQIVSNLLDNAKKYGRPPVRVEITSDGAKSRIAVIDRGEGVPATFVPQLFQAFTQVTVGDRRPSLGLGLGLTIARDLAAANDGELTYDDEHRDGARFLLTLPAP